MPQTSLTSLLCGAASVLAVASAADVPYCRALGKCTESNSTALTFDYGSHSDLTPKLLKTLKDNGVKPSASSSSPAGSIPTSSVGSGVPSVSLSKTKQSTSPVVIKPTASLGNGRRTSSVEMTTSTVYTTSVQTVTSCPPSVVSCPARVATVTVPLYTTICPVDAVATSTAKPGSEASTSVETRTAKVTKIHTITKCPPSVVNCPVGSTTTEVSSTTYCPGQQCGLPTGPAQPAAPKDGSGKKTPNNDGKVPSNKGSDKASSTKVERPSATKDVQTTKTGASTTVETRTAKVTKIRTITKCPPSVANCSVGSTTTEVSSTTYCPGQQCGLPTGPAQPAAPKDGSGKKTPNNDGKVPSNKGSDKPSGPKVECPSVAKDGQTPKKNGADSQTPSQGSKVPVAKPSSVGGKESGVKPSSPVPGKVRGGQGRNATVAGAAKPSASAAAPGCLGASCPSQQASKSSDYNAVTGAGAASFGIGAAPVVIGAILAML